MATKINEEDTKMIIYLIWYQLLRTVKLYSKSSLNSTTFLKTFTLAKQQYKLSFNNGPVIYLINVIIKRWWTGAGAIA